MKDSVKLSEDEIEVLRLCRQSLRNLAVIIPDNLGQCVSELKMINAAAYCKLWEQNGHLQSSCYSLNADGKRWTTQVQELASRVDEFCKIFYAIQEESKTEPPTNTE